MNKKLIITDNIIILRVEIKIFLSLCTCASNDDIAIFRNDKFDVMDIHSVFMYIYVYQLFSSGILIFIYFSALESFISIKQQDHSGHSTI